MPPPHKTRRQPSNLEKAPQPKRGGLDAEFFNTIRRLETFVPLTE